MKIICVGKNYTDHIKEFDGVIPKEMVLFMKPDTALHNLEIPYYIPDFTHNLHHEIEVVLKINQNGKCIAEKYAHKYYDEIALGIDFTALDLQRAAIAEGKPWLSAKVFDGSAVVGRWIDKEALGYPERPIPFALRHNGLEVQRSDSSYMIHSIDQLIAYISRYQTLRMGDLIFTGTPAGTGPVAIGDRLEGYLGEERVLELAIK